MNALPDLSASYGPLLILAIIAAIIFAILYFTTRASVDTRARLLYERWLREHESDIRRDAVERSRSVTIGKVTEHIAPWLPDFPYNPKDARFIGSPIDIIVFDGCDAGEVERVVFVEIKTSTSALSTRQRQIREVIKAGRIEWQELRIPTMV